MDSCRLEGYTAALERDEDGVGALLSYGLRGACGGPANFRVDLVIG